MSNFATSKLYDKVINMQFMQLLFLGFLAAFSNIIGGLIISFPTVYKRSKDYLQYFLAFGAGFMLAVIFVELLPRIFMLWQSNDQEGLVLPMVLVLGGYLLTQFFEHTIAPHIHLGEEVHHCEEHIISEKAAYTAIGGLLIHTFFDGVSISAAMQVDAKAGILVFLAIFLHKIPEGLTVASLILAAGKGIKQVLTATSIIGLTTLVGVMISGNLGISVKYALPLAVGITIYVAASDLIPELNHQGKKRPLLSVFVVLGVALFFALHYLLHIALEI